MPPKNILTGKRFGKLLVLHESNNKKGSNGSYYWHCLCDCGNTIEVRQDSLVGGKIMDCEHKRKYTPNDGFFTYPNPINSYWAGFIAADGCICGGDRVLSISSSSADIQHLVSFCNDVGLSNNALHTYHSFGGYKEHSTSSVALTSPRIIFDLKNNYNITSRKTFTLIPPNLKSIECINAFIVGLVDGDGWITKIYSKYKDKVYPYINIGISGTREICTWVVDTVRNECDMPNGSIHKNGNIYIGLLSGIIARHFYLIIKEYDIPKLDRKWSKIGDHIGV